MIWMRKVSLRNFKIQLNIPDPFDGTQVLLEYIQWHHYNNILILTIKFDRIECNNSFIYRVGLVPLVIIV